MTKKKKPKVAIVRGKFLNQYEMQTFQHLKKDYSLTAFGSYTSFHNKFPFPTRKLLSPMDIPDIPYKMQLLNRLFVDAHYLWNLEKELHGFDIAHSAETYYHYTQQCLNAKQKNAVRKVVVTVLENIPFNNEEIWGRKKFKKRVRTEADMLIALTQKTRTALVKEGADPEKIRVIGSGIDIKRFHPVDRNKRRKVTILFVGRLEEYKGVYDVLDAFQALIQDKELGDYLLNLVIVGEGSERKRMIEVEEGKSLTKFVKHTAVPYDSIHEIYQCADIFIAPSIDTHTWQEQYGYMLLEAQASGLPIITTNAGSIPEVVGDAAIVVRQHDVLALTRELKKLIRDKRYRNKMGAQSRKRAEEIHSSEIVARKISDVYKSLL